MEQIRGTDPPYRWHDCGLGCSQLSLVITCGENEIHYEFSKVESISRRRSRGLGIGTGRFTSAVSRPRFSCAIDFTSLCQFTALDSDSKIDCFIHCLIPNNLHAIDTTRPGPFASFAP